MVLSLLGVYTGLTATHLFLLNALLPPSAVGNAVAAEWFRGVPVVPSCPYTSRLSRLRPLPSSFIPVGALFLSEGD